MPNRIGPTLVAHLRLSAGRYENGWSAQADPVEQDRVINKLLLETKSGMTELIQALQRADEEGAALIVSRGVSVIATRRIVDADHSVLTLKLDPELDRLYLDAQVVDQRGPRLQWRRAETLERVALAR